MAANQPIGKLIMTSQEWEVSEGKGRQALKEVRQLDFIWLNWDTNRRVWFHFDMLFNKTIHLEGSPRLQ